MLRQLFIAASYSVFAVTSLVGCGGKSKTEEDASKFVLGNLVEPFQPPTLAEIDSKAEWIDRPVVDALELLRTALAKEPTQGNVAEALVLRNDSPEANVKILNILGRLPQKDADANYDASFVRHISGDINSPNPILSSSVSEANVNGLTSAGLFGFDWNFDKFAVKEFVNSWQTSKDRLFDKVVLRNDLTWSDGKPITAHDVVFSYQAIMSKEVPAMAQRSQTDKLRWVHAYDDRTLIYFHRESFVTNDQSINFSIIPKHVYEKSITEDPTLKDSDAHVALENNPVCGGPYRFKKRTRGQEILLERREDFYQFKGKQVRDKPYFKEIRFRVIQEPSVALLQLKAGDIDEMILNPEQWHTQTGDDAFYRTNTKAFGLEWTYFYFGWNNKSPLFSDKRVRQAMSYAFDHKEMLETLRFGLDQPCNGVFHYASKWFPKDAAPPYQRDRAKAEELLAAAGWVDHDGDGIRDKVIDGRPVKFEFTILVSNRQDRVDVCKLLKRNLEPMGINVTIRPMEFAALVDKLQKHEFQASFGGWGTGTDPDTMENLWSKNAAEVGRNYGLYINPEIDKLFAEGRLEFDPEKRREIYGKIHKTLYEDQPCTWLYFQNSYYGFNKSLRGYKFSPRGPYDYSPGSASLWKPVAAP